MLTCLALTLLATPAPCPSLAESGPQLESAGVLAFAPDGVLFVADPRGARVFALEMDEAPTSEREGLFAAGLDHEIGALVGIEADQLVIHDLAMHPASGSAYLSLSRGRGPDAVPLLARVTADGRIEVLDLEGLGFTSVALSNAPTGSDANARTDQRMASITDMEFHEGRLYVAGLSNEEFASKLHSIPYPFPETAEAGNGTSIEIYHGAHGAWETRAPVRTFATYEIEDTDHLLAAYTCTPLVKIPMREVVATMDAGTKVRGTTVAELGNRNTPLDMVVYEKDGSEYVLVANTSRGVMKISTEGIESDEGITRRIGTTAGLSYDTIDHLAEVVQLAPYDATRALALIQPRDTGEAHLETIELP